jgi:hypothetical protein
MRIDSAIENVRVGSLSELDALVGRYLTGEAPPSRWEDAHTHFQFDSVEEALDALHDPFFRQFSSEGDDRPAMLTEVKQYRPYSTDLTTAWDAVEHLSSNGEALQVRRDASRWVAAFGKGPAASADSAPIAICLAALRAKGIAVDAEKLVGSAAAAPSPEAQNGSGSTGRQ